MAKEIGKEVDDNVKPVFNDATPFELIERCSQLVPDAFHRLAIIKKQLET